jgi:hypothetical protein
MINSKKNNEIESRHKRGAFALAALTIAITSAMMIGCSTSDDPPVAVTPPAPVEPPALAVTGSSLACDAVNVTAGSTIASTLLVDPLSANSIQAINISKEEAKTGLAESEVRPNAGNTLKRLAVVVPGQTASGAIAYEEDGTTPIGDVRPLVVSYAEQVVGPYELGDGSADIGDPNTMDDIFVSLSLDNGATWKKDAVGDTADKSSIKVKWDGQTIDYNGHSHKSTMMAEGNKVLVAWNDKYCPSGNPFDLEDPTTEDYYKVNGNQGSIDYAGIVAPNGKTLYEVPFSCVWTARGMFVDPEGDGSYTIEWRQAQQLTSGSRDSNKIWIAAQDIGFALAWQEDTEGLRSGKGAGPGEGYSGATTNHGTDIWYTHIDMTDFDDVCTEFDADNVCIATTDDPAIIATLTEKPKPAVNFAYPVRITNNETCAPGDTKLYCADHCSTTVAVEKGNQSGDTVDRCVDDDIDYMTADATIAPEAAVLNGDTGASRPALQILKTNAAEPEYITVLAYEETKGLAESSQQDQGTVETDIAVEGKAVYFESFFWDQPVDISASRPVNLIVPGATVDSNDVVTLTGVDIYENARRVVIAPQVDTCQMAEGDYTFGLLYKQGYDVRGGPSDMFIRMNKGFTYDDFEDTAINISAREATYDVDGKVTAVSWSTDNLDDMSYDNPLDNTFSPRAFIRGDEIYTGFEYTPNWRQTSNGTTPNNFWINRFVAGAWQGPQQVTDVDGAKVSTLDPRFFTTPEGFATALESDNSNPDVMFLSYGTFDMESGLELDLFYSRSTDKGANWEVLDASGNWALIPGFDGIGDTTADYKHAKLASRDSVEEKEVQALATPDGTMMFNAWLQETETLCADPWCGLETRFGLVDYDTTVAP